MAGTLTISWILHTPNRRSVVIAKAAASFAAARVQPITIKLTPIARRTLS
jgi:hypothetical protein